MDDVVAGRSAGGAGEQNQAEGVPLAAPVGLAELGLAATGTVHEGGVSRVIQARTAAGELRAVRLIRPELVDTSESMLALEEWARRATAVRSAHLAVPLALGRLRSDSGVAPYLLMDWLDGRSLRHHLALRGQGVLPENAFHLVRQVAQGLADLHAAGVVHGDVRAESVLLTRQGRAVLLDVGVDPTLRRRAEDVRGVPWIAERHAPPERGNDDGQPISASSDVYQLGALTYEVFSGGSFSRWVPLEELSEMVDFLPAAMDELVQACLASPAERPADAAAFLARFVEVEQAFEENQRRGRTRDHGSTRHLWERAVALAAGERPPWGYVAGLCRRLLGVRPHLMPFGKVSERPVRELLEEAERRLRAGRREHLEGMLRRGSWAIASAFVDQLAEEVPAGEAEQLRLAVERARLDAAGGRPEVAAQVADRVLSFLKAPEISPEARLEAVELLERVMHRGGTAVSTPGRPVAIVTPTGELAAVEHWEVSGAPWHVVLGASMRLGRGSWEEFRNHVDLRPTREEVEESSSTLLLAQVLSRAGHLEFRVGRDGLEAVCLGTHGATVDGEELRRGEARTLGSQGSCRLANGAVELNYRLWSGAHGDPVAFTVRFTDGLGRGRSAAWVLQRLPVQALHPAGLECGVLLPTPRGWELEVWQDGVLVGDVPLASGARRLWSRGEVVQLPGGVSLRRSS